MRFLTNLFAGRPAKGSKAGVRLSRPLKNDEIRMAVRKRQRMVDGFVWAENMLVARGCKVHDISAVGAAIEFWQAQNQGSLKQAPLPDRVMLHIVPDKLEVDCDVTWRKENSVGLRFVGKFRPSSRKFGRN